MPHRKTIDPAVDQALYARAAWEVEHDSGNRREAFWAASHFAELWNELDRDQRADYARHYAAERADPSAA